LKPMYNRGLRGKGSAVALEPFKAQQRIDLGEGVEFDPTSNELCRGGRAFKLERIPAAVLLLLVERAGQVVQREQIVDRVWGKDVFLDTDNSINSAIRKIRRALKDDSDSPRFIQTISGRGYRFLAAAESDQKGVIPSSTVDASAIAEARTPFDQTPSTGSSSGKRLWNRARLLTLAVAVLAIVAAVFLLGRNAGKPTPHSPIRSIAVLPLQNLSGDSQDYLADGMTESIIGRLSAIRELRVISRTSSMRFKDTKLSVPEIARQLNVDAIVEGSVIRAGNRIRVHAQLIRAANDAHFWSESYDRALGDVLTLESDLAQAIAEKVEVTVTGQERSKLVAAPYVSPEVYESYLKGQFALRKSNNRSDIEESIRDFDETIRQDPSFAAAYLGLANAYNELGTVFIGAPPAQTRAKVITTARKALELDSELAEAHVQLAAVYQREWRWSDAEAEYKWALQLRPNDASAHVGFANWLLAEGRIEEAMEWSKRARELDPLAVTGKDLAWILFSARRYDEAIRELHATLTVTPDDASALWFLGFSLIGEGKPEDAIVPLERAVSLTHGSPGAMGVLARAYGHAGRRSDAFRLIEELKRRQQQGYVPTASFVQAYVGIADYDAAFAWFERAYEEKSNILQWIKVEPFPDVMRNDPRFADLIHRVGLDQPR
jgi:TolB-like protein/DNA-binding winged helix-turn-helix (wHTH) protein/Flp pilus assembly protein TadD